MTETLNTVISIITNILIASIDTIIYCFVSPFTSSSKGKDLY